MLSAIWMHRMFVFSPAEVMRSKSFFVHHGLKGINSIFYNEVGIPLKAFIAVFCLSHIPTVWFSISHKAIIWACKVFHRQSHDARIKQGKRQPQCRCNIYQRGRNVLYTLEGTGSQSHYHPLRMYPHFGMDQADTRKLWQKTANRKRLFKRTARLKIKKSNTQLMLCIAVKK